MIVGRRRGGGRQAEAGETAATANALLGRDAADAIATGLPAVAILLLAILFELARITGVRRLIPSPPDAAASLVVTEKIYALRGPRREAEHQNRRRNVSSWKRVRSPMHLTRKGDHAVRALLTLLRQPDGNRLTAHGLAEQTRIPEEFLRKILTALARAGIVRTLRGPGGGVRLARAPKDILLLEVVEAVEGPVILNECLRTPPACPWIDGCTAYPVWKRAQEQLRQTLAAATLESLRGHPCHDGRGAYVPLASATGRPP